MKSFNLPETISQIQLSLKPERKHTAPTNPIVFAEASIEAIATWGSTRANQIPTGFFCEGPSAMYLLSMHPPTDILGFLLFV